MTESQQSINVQELSHSMVHYLLTIHKLKEKRGYARVTDIATDLGLTKGSVSTALNNLKKKDLISEEETSKFLILTEAGHNTVHEVLSSRTLLFYFLKDFLGVSEEAAQRDACLMEHLIGQETREKFFHYMKTFSCHCDSKDLSNLMKQIKKTEFDLCKFENTNDFIEGQDAETNLIGD